MLFRLVLGKEKLIILVTSSELNQVLFDQFTQDKEQKKPIYFYFELWLEVE